jgi:hypothetical protein
MSRGGVGLWWRNALALLACAAAAVTGGCAGDGSGGGSAEFGYGVYYGSAWGYDDIYYDGPIYVGPPDSPPPGTNPPRPDARPPHVSHQPVRPMPPSRPAPRGGGRRR